MKKTLQRITILALTIITFISCSKESNIDENINPNVNSIKTKLIPTSGGVIETNNGIKITFPNGALPNETEVSIGVSGNEPTTVPNLNLELIGQPFSLDIPVNSLGKEVLIEFLKPTDFTFPEEIAYFAFNGETYLPLLYDAVDNKIIIKLDIINYQEDYNSTINKTNKSSKTKILGNLIILGLINEQTPPSEQLGLKQISLGTNNKLIFNDIQPISENDKVIVFVHGWIGAPSVWREAIPKFFNNTDYNKILTFGYNSSLSIDENGEKLANILKSKIVNNKVDLVAHSMGGLVSRSAIENYNSTSFVNNLITLGTPHQGSPLAATRYFLGAIVLLDNPLSLITFNLNTQGFKDLLPNSNFIKQINSNQQTSLPYYAISAINAPCVNVPSLLKQTCWIPSVSDKILKDDDDGIVSKSSALGIKENYNLDLPTEFFISDYMAHTKMASSETIINNVIDYLSKQAIPKIYEGSVTLNTQQEVNDFANNKYIEITGTLMIGRYDDQNIISNINDLTPLSSLIKVKELNIYNNPQLTTLQGLQNISSIENTLTIYRNNISSLNGLSGLINVYSLAITQNNSLLDLNGLNSGLSNVGFLSITSNPILTSIAGLSNISSVNSGNQSQSNQSVFWITNNNSLKNLKGLENLKEVGWALRIEDNLLLESLEGLENLNLVGNNFEITGNNMLFDFCSLQNYFSNTTLNPYIVNNKFNPTKQDIIDGNCRE